MKVSRLTLKHFRNYTDLALDCAPGRNIILGKNGQGKTNLLEALYFLSHTKSNRSGSDRELIQFTSSQTLIAAEILPTHYDGTLTLQASLSIADGSSEGQGRLQTKFKINGAPAKQRSAVLGYIPTVGFFLSDLQLLRGTPEDRRKWLDAAATQYDKRHLSYATEYHRIRTQKSRLLKNDPAQISIEHLTVWNQQLAKAGAQLMASRMQYLSAAEHPAMATYAELSGAGETLSLAYQSAVEARDTIEVSQLEEALNALLLERQNEELRRGTCLVGPHRDDIAFFLNEKNAAAYGSQGQQRSIVLALKLTELQLLKTKLGESPVLLLDDVMAELDPDRQGYLLDHLSPEGQVFLSTTHLDATLNGLLGKDTCVFEVQAGNVTAQSIGKVAHL